MAAASSLSTKQSSRSTPIWRNAMAAVMISASVAPMVLLVTVYGVVMGAIP